MLLPEFPNICAWPLYSAAPYAPPEIVEIEKKPILGMNDGEAETITTSHVERHNSTIRTLMKRFTRLTLGYSKKREALEAACAVFLAYYNFVWRTRKPNSGKLRLPAAMAAGIIDELWDFKRMYDEVTEHTYGD